MRTPPHANVLLRNRLILLLAAAGAIAATAVTTTAAAVAAFTAAAATATALATRWVELFLSGVAHDEHLAAIFNGLPRQLVIEIDGHMAGSYLGDDALNAHPVAGEHGHHSTLKHALGVKLAINLKERALKLLHHRRVYLAKGVGGRQSEVEAITGLEALKVAGKSLKHAGLVTKDEAVGPLLGKLINHYFLVALQNHDLIGNFHKFSFGDGFHI